RNILR
ncbi:nef attachable domain protein, partial [Chlamydia psittaci 02DC14]